MGRISHQELTASAKAELQPVLEELIKNQEDRFVAFFNVSQPVTPRMHALELLPGIGKKSMWQIVNAREKKQFVSFKDIRERTSISDPVRIVARRIVDELGGEGKYRLFTRTV
jgi:putative nucleotide binding protein